MYPFSRPVLPKRTNSSPHHHAQLDNFPQENTPIIECQPEDWGCLPEGWGFDIQKTTPTTPVWDWDDEFLKLTPTPTTLTLPTDARTTETTTFTDTTTLRTLWDDPFPFITPSTLSAKTMPTSLTTIHEYPNEPIKDICHKIYTFDLDNPDLGWSEGESLISPRIYPKLVPYQGKLYAFSGNHPSLSFAEVYDPISATWTALPPAPFRRLPAPQMVVVPLNGWNKLWVFSTHRAVDYTFDVLTQKWHKFSGARVILPHFAAHQNLVSALTPKNHMVVYWVNQREEVYAYNLSTNQIFKGIISGAEEKKPLLRLGLPLVLHHLRRDLFCLIGCTFLSNPNPNPRVLHVVILQISFKTPPKSSKPLMPTKSSSKIHKTPPNPLSAAVLACFAYSFGEVGIKDTYIM
ncbi:uncharacterized protein LOC141652022 [Silene latifolia]|uniref:uncharacterized protein LOC141652022 n=1 Tax=Silene latifolia TaxID=37657 RepID=UPI003D774E4F